MTRQTDVVNHGKRELTFVPVSTAPLLSDEPAQLVYPDWDEPLIQLTSVPLCDTLSCTSCGASRAYRGRAAADAILAFQELHFDCDPHLARGVTP